MACSPNLLQQLQTAAVGQIDIENQQIKAGFLKGIASLRQRTAQRNLYGRALQRQTNATAQRDIIFQQEYLLHTGTFFPFLHHSTGKRESRCRQFLSLSYRPDYSIVENRKKRRTSLLLFLNIS